jgi:hypothetical protein
MRAWAALLKRGGHVVGARRPARPLPGQTASNPKPRPQGTAGARPDAAALAGQLASHDVYLYFGHGGGEQYVSPALLRRLQRCAGSLLMGCSSGRLRANGEYEAGGAIWSYLIAGCPAAVANLWDVTDRCGAGCRCAWVALGRPSRGSAPLPNPEGASLVLDAQLPRREMLPACAPSTPGSRCACHRATTQRNPPWQPRRDTDRFGRAVLDGWLGRGTATGDGDGRGSSSGSGKSGSAGGRPGGCAMPGSAVAAGRRVCRLPNLIGAAPVVYGVPCLIDATQLHEARQ